MLIDNDCKATIGEDVLFTELEGEAVLLDLHTKLYFSLNNTGVAIWKCLEQEMSIAESVEKICDDYDVLPEQAEKSINQLITALQNEKLIQIVQNIDTAVISES